MGLEGGGMLREPTALVLAFRMDMRSSFSPAASPTPLGLRFGWVVPGNEGPPERDGQKERERCGDTDRKEGS